MRDEDLTFAEVTTQTVQLPDSHVLVPKRVHKESFGRFQAIAPLRTSTSSPMDIFDLFEQIPKSSIKQFNLIKLGRDPETNICVIDKPYNNRSEQVVFSRYVNELKRVGLIKKVNRNLHTAGKNQLVYIINPAFIKCYAISNAEKLWSALK